jgi:ribonuclease Y
MNIITILWYIAAAIFGIAIGYIGYRKTLTERAKAFKARMNKAKELEEEIIEEAKRKAEKIKEIAEQKAQEAEEKRIEKMESIENRLLAREEKLEEKLNKIEQEKEILKEHEKEIQKIIDEQSEKLAEISWLDKEEAKEKLFENIKATHEKELKDFIEKLKMIKKEEADIEAWKIIARSLPRISWECVWEFTTVIVDIPTEDLKGKLIGREWRNISFFEKMTWAELIVDDTPLVVRVSCYDHEKRFVAVTVLQRLIKDGRINPFYIEKITNEVAADIDNILIEKWKQALTMLNMTMMKPEIVKLIGQFYLRYSYGQNLRNHSIEVARISEAIASEMWEDPVLAKKAWLLHDIGKIQATGWQSHTTIGAEILKKHNMDDVVINAAASHHYDVPMTHTISWIVAAADAISASRPGARFNTKELFIEKMSELEKLIYTVQWVDKVHIMQAWREIMIYVDPKKISDIQVEELLKTIANKIEEQLDYPWIIRVTWIRETKLIEYVK